MPQLIKDLRLMAKYRHLNRARWPWAKLRIWQLLVIGFSLLALSPLVLLLLIHWLGRGAETVMETLAELPPFSSLRSYNSKLQRRRTSFAWKCHKLRGRTPPR